MAKIKTIAESAEQLEMDLERQRLTKQQRGTDKKYRLLQDKLAQLEEQLEAVKQIQDISTFSIPDRGSEGGEATAIVLASDWHIEERVDPTTVNNRNNFTLPVAAQRMDCFFANTAKLVKAKRRSIEVKTLILALLGDFISNDIHEELVESAQLSPIEATIFAMNHIASGIRYLLRKTDLELVLPCHSGNHARTTKKVRAATERGHSLEYFMYHSLANSFAAEPRVSFCVAGGYHSYTDIGDSFRIRWHHGHAVRYAGGVGGITIPVNKAVAEWNKAESGNVDLDCFGHFHQRLAGRNFVANGSLIGWSPFALFIKAPYEPPAQTFFLVNHKRRAVTDLCPVWLD